MKRALICIVKIISIFLLWALSINLFPDINSDNAAVKRLWWELTPLLSIIVFTFIYTKLLENGRLNICFFNNAGRAVTIGALLGAIWIFSSISILYAMGVLSFDGINNVPNTAIWLLAVFLNAAMQEILVRGYMYQLIKREYNIMTSALITTALFTALHGGAFEAGITAVLNVFTMSLLVTLLFEYTQSLLAPVTAHFIWNGAGCILFGAVSLADDYPFALNCTFTGNPIISGGIYKLEGSIVTLIINTLLGVFLYCLIKVGYAQNSAQKWRYNENKKSRNQ